MFLPTSPEKSFTLSGFRDWKHAKGKGTETNSKGKIKEKKKGLDQHASCYSHKEAMVLWADSEKRSIQCTTIQHTSSKITTDQQQWLFAVFNVSRYLAANGLPFRGDCESNIEEGDGLYFAFSQLLFPLHPKNTHKHLPMNAKYTSPPIQNEVISILTKLVKRKIAAEIRNAKIHTIMADGTTDKNRKEIHDLVCRYLSSEGKIVEHCLNVSGVDDRSAKGVFGFIKETLREFEISSDGIVSQSYDGANVMSGEYNGLQALISEFCNRFILYEHSFLHKICLVVMQVMESIDEIQEYISSFQACTNSLRSPLFWNFTRGRS